MRQSRTIDNIFADAIFQLEKEWKDHKYGDELFRDVTASKGNSAGAATVSTPIDPKLASSSTGDRVEPEEEEDLSALLAECREEFRPGESEEEDLSALLAECREEFRPGESEEEEEDLSALLAECREEFRPGESEEEEEDLSALLAECREEFRPGESEEEEEDLSALLAECREEFRPGESDKAEEEEEDLSALLAECREEFRPGESDKAEEEEEDLSALLAECREEFRPGESDKTEEEEEDLSALLAECREEFRPGESDKAEEEEEEDLSALLAECREEFRPGESDKAEEEEEDLSALLAECREEFRPGESEEEEDLSALLAECREEFRPGESDKAEEEEEDLSALLAECREEFRPGESDEAEEEGSWDESLFDYVDEDDLSSDEVDEFSNILDFAESDDGEDSFYIDNTADSLKPEENVVNAKNNDDDSFDFDDVSSDLDSDEDLDSLLDDLTSDSSFSGLDEQEESELEDALNEAISSLEESSDTLESGSIGDLMESAFDIDSEFDVEEEEAAAAEVSEPSLNAFDFNNTGTMTEIDPSELQNRELYADQPDDLFDDLKSEIEYIESEVDGDDYVVGVETVPVPKPSIDLIEDSDDENVDQMLVDMGFGSDGLLHNKFGPNKEKLLEHLIHRFEYLARRKLESFPDAQAEFVKSINLRIEIDLKFGKYSTDGEDDSLFSLDV